MAEIVITSHLRIVSDKLASKALSEFKLQTGIDKELKKLARTLSTIRDVLEDAEARQVKDKALRSWLRELKDLAYDADDVLDEIAFEAEKSKEDDMKKKVYNLLSLTKKIPFRHKIAHRVKEINERLDDIAKNRSNFHLKEGVVQNLKIESSTMKEETGSYSRESEVYGRQGDKEKIVELLMNTSTEGDNIDVIGIVGLGGLGKTTLARLVYNEESLDGHFEKKMWVCVSEEFEIRKLIRVMIESATGKKFSSPISMDALQESLINEIKEKRFLLVLDDVWNESYEKWDGLRSLLIFGARGSKVIVTTRNMQVASIMGAISPHQLSSLSFDDCWLLFERRAFGIGVERNQILVEIGKEIVKKCGGLPLAAKALGSMLMSRKTTENEWLAIKNSDLWELYDDKNNDVLPALKLSYDHLSSALKQCFAYCSIFWKDYAININILVKLWGAEGFLKPSESQRQMHWEDIGLGYVRDLLARSLLFQDRMSGQKYVKMHDLVHDLAQSVAGDECSILDTATGRNLSQNSRYASFICTNEKPLSVALQSPCNARKLRTFYLDDGMAEETDQQSVQEVLHVISCDINRLRALRLAWYPLKALPNSFEKLKHLRYLDLSNTPLEFFPPCINTLHNLQTLDFRNSQIESIPDSIGNLHNLYTLDFGGSLSLSSVPSSISQLKCLRELDLSRTQIESLPESICTLSNLHTLGLERCHLIDELPQNLSNMKSLVHLNIKNCRGLTHLPVNLGKLNQLRTLPFFIRGGKTDCSSLTELGSLKLEGDQLELKKLENVRNVEEAKGAQLSDKHRIQSLKLSWGTSSYVDDVKIQLAEDVLQSLQPTKCLRNLRIENYVGRTFPPWMESSLLNLGCLTLNRCNCVKIPALGQLPQLKVLEIKSLPLIKHLGFDFYGGANAFPSLQNLELHDMIGLEEWCGAGGEQLHPRLHRLILRGCPKLKALPSKFSSVKYLDMNVDDKLLLSSLQNRGFRFCPMLKSITMRNRNYMIDPMLTDSADSLRTLAENLNFDVLSGAWGIRLHRVLYRSIESHFGQPHFPCYANNSNKNYVREMPPENMRLFRDKLDGLL